MTIQKLLCSTAAAALLVIGVGAQAADAPKAPTAQNAQTTMPSTAVQADRLIGASVKNEANETVGDVESVIIGEDGKVRALVVGVGGFLGLGERLVALDWNQIRVNQDGNSVKDVRVSMSKEQAKALPEYKYRETSWRGTAYRDTGYRSASDMRTDRATTARNDRPAAGAAATDRPMRGDVSAKSIMTPDGKLKASEVIGMSVVNDKQEKIGDIDEVLFDKAGKPQVVLGVGGFLGVGERNVLVDWSRLTLHREGDDVQLRMSTTADDLKKMPAYEPRS
ncbi:MAG: PRC-barrel domain-containing protein [Rhodospirillales bacterium]